MEATIYHNPSCGTSRNTLALLRHLGIEPQVIVYLATPPDQATQVGLITAAGLPDHETELDLSTLSLEGQSLREAILSYDLTEVRFRAQRMADVATLLGFAEISVAARSLVEALGPEGKRPSLAYGEALFTLSDTLEEALNAAR